MTKLFKNFRNDEAGAVTVDWVVLTAAVVGLAIVAYGTIKDNTQNLANEISAKVAAEQTILNGIKP